MNCHAKPLKSSKINIRPYRVPNLSYILPKPKRMILEAIDVQTKKNAALLQRLFFFIQTDH
ncbi:MAG TPA: hypothetical protein DCL74_00440 [Succinivibrionaceae bacterium]|nr:hypothetical protein [Succinivibrionaceae bacterium]